MKPLLLTLFLVSFKGLAGSIQEFKCYEKTDTSDETFVISLNQEKSRATLTQRNHVEIIKLATNVKYQKRSTELFDMVRVDNVFGLLFGKLRASSPQGFIVNNDKMTVKVNCFLESP